MSTELGNGTTLQNGKYTIINSLGQGSFGITYLATTKLTMTGKLGQMDTTVNVAIKEFFMSEMNSRANDGSSLDGSSGSLFYNYQQKFRKEAENLSRLDHPNIVKVLEVFDENNTTYYVMQYIDGESLDNYILRQNGLPEQEAISILKEIGSAVQYMHSNKMLHLDLKPKNVMLDKDGKGYLIDFGLSKQYTDNGEPESSTSIGLGTPGYAPLEQASYKQDGTLPVTLDIYALGASLFKMLTGKTPPESSAILNEGFPMSSLQRTGISVYTISIVEKAMASVKKDRYQSVNSMLNAIENLTSNLELISPDENESDTVFDEEIVSSNVETEIKISHYVKDSRDIDKSKSERKNGLFIIIGIGFVLFLLLFGNLSRELVPTLVYSFGATFILGTATGILLNNTTLGWKRSGIIGGLFVLILLLLFAVSNIPLEIRNIVGYRTGDAEDFLIKNWNIGILGTCLSILFLIYYIFAKKKIWGFISIGGLILSLFFLVFFVISEKDSARLIEPAKEEIVKFEIKAIDLGLPSGTLWANCNLGAKSEQYDGDHYAFGTIESKDDYPDNTGEQFADGESIIGTSYDVAHTKFGSEWQLPSKKQMQELIQKCRFIIRTEGYDVIGPNGNKIFLPYTRGNSNIGYYWSGNKGYVLEFQPGYKKSNQDDEAELRNNFATYCGLSVRPVKK